MIYLFGAGHCGRVLLADMLSSGWIKHQIGFVDNDSDKWGTEVDGVPVFRPSVLSRDSRVVVTVYTSGAVKKQLDSLGIPWISHWSIRVGDGLVPHAAIDDPLLTASKKANIDTARTLWADESSCREFDAQVEYRLTGTDPTYTGAEVSARCIYHTHLLPAGWYNYHVDCGAFDGSTFSGVRGMMIEADPGNFERLAERYEHCSYDLRHAAVSDSDGSLSFRALGDQSSRADSRGHITVPSYKLDTLLADKTPTYIKMDIEGKELAALHGAVKTLKRCRPSLAICLYHTYDHLWAIPLFLDSLKLGYKFYLRRYSDECWETILYAIPG